MPIATAQTGGVLSTLSGYPSFPTHSVMKMPAKSRTLSGIAQELQRVGYATDFLYGGDANFTNMKGYLLGSGYERVIDDRDLDRSLPRQSWGVQDGATFDYLYRAIQQRGTDRPWHTGFLTLSSHEPFIVPYQRFAEEVPNAFAYVDDCIGRFADRLRKTKAWDNLLVICVADHGYSTGPSEERHTSQIHHIPMLWFGGAIKEPRRIDQLMTQSDLAATLLAQLGLSYRDFPFSRNYPSSQLHLPLRLLYLQRWLWLHRLHGRNRHGERRRATPRAAPLSLRRTYRPRACPPADDPRRPRSPIASSQPK